MSPAKTSTPLRVARDLLERVDALIAVMAADPEVRALGMPTASPPGTATWGIPRG